MARIPKPKKVKRPKPEPSDHACDLCGTEMTDEVLFGEDPEAPAAAFTMSSRPCLIPGWEAIVALAPKAVSMPVVWGMTLTQVCPRCRPDLDSYHALITALMEQDGAEPQKNVIANPPLTWSEAQAMMAAHTNGTPVSVTLNEGRWRKDVFGSEEDAA
jgi:hypothetical protein